MNRLKLVVCAVWAMLIVSFASFHSSTKTSGQKNNVSGSIGVSSESIPDSSVVDRFDTAVQKRFLTEPNFGARRMLPTTPEPLESAHVGSFSPVNDDEKDVVSAFQNDGWRVGLYLFGRRAEPNGKEKNPLEKFKIRYRINQPIPVTWGLREKHLPNSKKLIKEVKEAFLRFQAANRSDENNFQFQKGEWTFVARPVRAVNDSCVRCHTDYVVTNRLDDGRFQFRKRAVGDVNGVIVYGFSKEEKPN